MIAPPTARPRSAPSTRSRPCGIPKKWGARPGLNYALPRCDTDLVMVVDGDTFLAPDYLETRPASSPILRSPWRPVWSWRERAHRGRARPERGAALRLRFLPAHQSLAGAPMSSRAPPCTGWKSCAAMAAGPPIPCAKTSSTPGSRSSAGRNCLRARRRGVDRRSANRADAGQAGQPLDVLSVQSCRIHRKDAPHSRCSPCGCWFSC